MRHDRDLCARPFERVDDASPDEERTRVRPAGTPAGLTTSGTVQAALSPPRRAYSNRISSIQTVLLPPCQKLSAS